MRWIASTVFVVLAVLGLIWVVRSCQQGKTPINAAVDTVEQAADDVGDASR
jgi:hypothetical protein